jgi:LmbE family N-acetylglucosaminyl deacetylase
MTSHRLAVVVAHPDDDTFGCSGTVALHAKDPAFRFVLIHVTSGENGEIADPSLATPETLGEVREEEDRRSWVALGREPDRHEWLRYPDHGVAGAGEEALVEALLGVLRDEHPDVVMTFGPDGVSGHPDHIAVGRAATRAFHRLREDGEEGFRRLLHHGLPQSVLDEWNARLVADGKSPMDPTELYMPRGVPDETIGVHVDCTDVIDRKLAAFAEHATQAGGSDDLVTEEDRRRAFGFETHVIAWPRRDDDGPVLADVFEGLDRDD